MAKITLVTVSFTSQYVRRRKTIIRYIVVSESKSVNKSVSRFDPRRAVVEKYETLKNF